MNSSILVLMLIASLMSVSLSHPLIGIGAKTIGNIAIPLISIGGSLLAARTIDDIYKKGKIPALPAFPFSLSQTLDHGVPEPYIVGRTLDLPSLPSMQMPHFALPQLGHGGHGLLG